MHLSYITLANFNNYAHADVQVHERMNAFTGLNGAGKTNILDAIYYLCLGKSYFSSTDKHVVRKGEEFFRVEGMFDTRRGVEKVEIKVNPGQRKEILFSGKKRAKLSDHIGALPCIIVAPIDIQLMLEGSEQRRKFLDNTIMQYDKAYVSDILKYNRLLKQRNTTLKAFAEKHYYDQGLIDSISAGMYTPASNIFDRRQQLVDGLTPLFEKYYDTISGKKESCTIGYESKLSEQSLEELFYENREKDKVLARTSAGIHKDDINFRMNGISLKNFASQGQLKSFVLALKLAQYEIVAQCSGSLPILLLDDIFDKLDKERVGQLLEMLSAENFGQVFISDTDVDRVPQLLQDKDIHHAAYVVDNGNITTC